LLHEPAAANMPLLIKIRQPDVERPEQLWNDFVILDQRDVFPKACPASRTEIQQSQAIHFRALAL
jgi:hypothetical protein